MFFRDRGVGACPQVTKRGRGRSFDTQDASQSKLRVLHITVACCAGCVEEDSVEAVRVARDRNHVRTVPFPHRNISHDLIASCISRVFAIDGYVVDDDHQVETTEFKSYLRREHVGTQTFLTKQPRTQRKRRHVPAWDLCPISAMNRYFAEHHSTRDENSTI